MSRPKKSITTFLEVLDKLSYREKLKEYLRFFFIFDNDDVDKKIKLIYKSFSHEEKLLFDDYYNEIFRCIIFERYKLQLIIEKVNSYSIYINCALREIEENEYTVSLLNILLSRIKDKALAESPEEIENVTSYRGIEKEIRSYCTLSGGTNIDNTNYYLNLDYSPYKAEIDRAINGLTKTLRIAKGFSVALQEFIDKYKIDDLIPKEIKFFEDCYRRDLSDNWWNSYRVFTEYSKKENRTKEEDYKISKIKESKLFPNLFPDYYNVEPAEEMIGKNNIFINQCAAKKNI